MHEGAIATGTVINDKGWQVVKPGTVATDTVVNTGAEGGPDAENGDTGQFVRGDAVRTTINKNGRQIVRAEGTANTTVVYAGGDQTVHGHALDTTLNGGYQYVHNGGNRAEMSPEAAGIAACLMTYSHHACRTENYAMTVHYYRLRDYALQHPECSAIMRIID